MKFTLQMLSALSEKAQEQMARLLHRAEKGCCTLGKVLRCEALRTMKLTLLTGFQGL